jgi:hypothetical protein
LPQPDFELDITDVSPQLPISHFPLTISFVLRNNTQHAVTGYVDASFIQERYRVNNLAPGTVLNGSLTGTVTAQAGRGQTLQLSFSKDDNTEFPNKSATSYGLGYDIAARFMFRIENIQCVQIRSCGVIVAGFDTDYVYFVVKVGDQEHPVPEFRYKFVGKAFGGTNDIIPVDMQTDWIDVVPGYGTPVAIAYNVLNHGAQWLQLGKKIEDEISYAAKAALDAILPADKDTWDQLDKFTQWLNAFKFAGQDGSCVSDLIDRADESTLLTMDVISPENFDQIYFQDFPGHVPQYNVTWSVIRL